MKNLYLPANVLICYLFWLTCISCSIKRSEIRKREKAQFKKGHTADERLAKYNIINGEVVWSVLSTDRKIKSVAKQYYRDSLGSDTLILFRKDVDYFDTNGKLIETEYSLSPNIRYIYKGTGHDTTIYEYQGKELFSREVNQYNNVGKEIEHIDYTGISDTIFDKTAYKYDSDDNLIEVSSTNHDMETEKDSFKYQTGLIIEALSYKDDKLTGRIKYKYDSIGNNVKNIVYRDDSFPYETILYKYDAYGNVIEKNEHIQQGNTLSPFVYNRMTRYTYNKGHLTSIYSRGVQEDNKQVSARLHELSYDPAGNLVKYATFRLSDNGKILIGKIVYAIAYY